MVCHWWVLLPFPKWFSTKSWLFWYMGFNKILQAKTVRFNRKNKFHRNNVCYIIYYLPIHERLILMDSTSIGWDIPDSPRGHPSWGQPECWGVKTSRTCADRSGWCCLLCGGFQGSGWKMKTVDSWWWVDCDSQQPFKRLRGHGWSSPSPFNRKALMMEIDFIIQFFMAMGGGSIHSDVLGVSFSGIGWFCKSKMVLLLCRNLLCRIFGNRCRNP